MNINGVEIADRRTAKESLPPALADMLRAIADDMEPDLSVDMDGPFRDLMCVNAQSLRNIAALVERVRLERRTVDPRFETVEDWAKSHKPPVGAASNPLWQGGHMVADQLDEDPNYRP